jgi:hypothetical protein
MPNWPAKQERRRWRRHWLNSPVRIISDAGEMDGFGLHVSEGGMYLFAVADLEPGTHLEIEFQKPQSGEPSRCSGVVRNRVVYLYGVEFVRDGSFNSRRQPEAQVHS